MFSSTGTRSDSGIGLSKLHTFSAAEPSSSVWRVMEIDRERALGGEPFDGLDVGDRGVRRIGFAIGGGKRRRETSSRFRVPAPVPCACEIASSRRSSQVRTMFADRAFKLGARNIRRVCRRTADDVVDAHQRPFGVVGIKRRQPPVIRLDEIFSDLDVDVAVVALARHDTRAPRRSGESGPAAPARARAAARRDKGSPARTRRADRRRSGTVRRADRFPAH